MVNFSGLGGSSLGSLIVRIDADNTKLKKGLNEADGRVLKTGKRLDVLTKNVETTVRSINLLGTAFFVVAGLLVKSASNFETAFAGVRKTVDATEDEFFQLSEGLLKMSKRIPVAAAKLAKIQEVAGQLGIRGVANLTKFTETMALLSETTNILGEVGTLQLSRFMGIMGVADTEVDRLGSALVDLGNNFKTQEAELLHISKNLAAFGVQVGLTAQQVLAFGTAIISAGGESAAAATAFQKVALKMKDAVITGNADLQSFAEIAGLTSEQFVEAFKEDAGEAIVLFLEGLKKITEEGGSVTTALNKIGLADIRLTRELGKVTTQTDTLREALIRSNTAFEENVALNEEAAKRFGTTGSKTLLLKNKINVLSIKLGEKLLPAFKNILISANAVVGVFDKLFGERKGPDTLLGSLNARLEFLDKEIQSLKKIREISSLGAQARIDIENRINAAMVNRERTLATITTLEQERAAAQAEQEVTDEKNLRTGASTEVGIEAAKEKTIHKEFNKFKKLVAAANKIELKQLLADSKVEELTEKNLQEKKTKYLEEELKAREKAEKESARLTDEIRTSSFNLAVSLIQNLAGESRIAAIAIKAIRIGEAIINTSLAVTRALAEHPFPLSTAIATKVKILGALQIATIVAQGFKDGSEDVPIGGGFTHPGEIVIPRNFADAIRENRLTLSGPEDGQQVARNGDITNNFQFDNVQLGDDIELEDFTTKLGEDILTKIRSVS